MDLGEKKLLLKDLLIVFSAFALGYVFSLILFFLYFPAAFSISVTFGRFIGEQGLILALIFLGIALFTIGLGGLIFAIEKSFGRTKKFHYGPVIIAFLFGAIVGAFFARRGMNKYIFLLQLVSFTWAGYKIGQAIFKKSVRN